jgi:hypothetical protein
VSLSGSNMASVLSLRLRTSRTHDKMSYNARVCCSVFLVSASPAQDK